VTRMQRSDLLIKRCHPWRVFYPLDDMMWNAWRYSTRRDLVGEKGLSCGLERFHQ
jgi:hypothetical protein